MPKYTDLILHCYNARNIFNNFEKFVYKMEKKNVYVTVLGR